MIIDPIRRVIYARGFATGLLNLGPVFAGEPDRVYRVNPRRVNYKRKANDRAHRKAVKRMKAIARRACK